MSNVDIDDLAVAVMEGLEEYVELAEDAMKDAVTQTAKAVRKELVATSPDGKTGRYRKGWRASVVEQPEVSDRTPAGKGARQAEWWACGCQTARCSGRGTRCRDAGNPDYRSVGRLSV